LDRFMPIGPACIVTSNSWPSILSLLSLLPVSISKNPKCVRTFHFQLNHQRGPLPLLYTN
jgi:hypothetical protein